MKIDRYQRHSLIDWFSQEDVRASSFAVIGCGAVGNEVSKNLALLGVGKIDLFDFDTIEIHNLTRSVLFREEDIGLNKAEVAAARIRELDHNVEVRAFAGDFWELLTLEQTKSYDCVLCCVDNFEARIKLNQLCLLTGTNLINTGIDSKFGQVEIFPFKAGRHISCYECNLPNSAYERMQNRYSCGWLKKISFIEKKIPTTIITSSLTGSLAVANALNFINSKALHDSKRILIDTFTGMSTVSTIEQSSTCPACSNIRDRISIVKGSSIIESEFPLNSKAYITTSDPVLTSFRCVNCQPNEDDSIVVFEKAAKFDSTLTLCKSCGSDSVDITIKDSFEVEELLTNFYGKNLPVKFIRIDTEESTTIIELE